MRPLRDTVWQRRGVSWIWDDEALRQVCDAREAWSLRQLIRAGGNWPDDLPSNASNSLVVGGLDGSLDLLSPSDAEDWLGSTVKEVILSFQQCFEGDGALVFWIPNGRSRLHVNSATDAVSWRCAHPHGGETIDFGRVLWGEANEYPQEILLSEGGASAGLFHLRIT